MLERTVQSKKRYFISFLIGTFLFFLLFSLGYLVASLQYNRISNMQTDIAYSIFDGKFSYTLFGSDICLENNFKEVSGLLAFQGRSLEDLESKFGKSDEDILDQKKFYTALLLEHLDYVNLYNEKCGSNIDYILFFYSNNNSYEDSANKAGRVLDEVHKDRENLVIYSFDYDLDSDIISNLKQKYKVEKIPSIIINGNQSLIWPFRPDQIGFN